MRLLALLLAAPALLLTSAVPASAQAPVGCGNPQSVIRIEGLKGAIPYGDPEKFTLSWDNAPGASASNAHIKITDTDTDSGEVSSPAGSSRKRRARSSSGSTSTTAPPTSP